MLGELARADRSIQHALALDSTLATTWGWYGLLAGRLGEYAAAHDRIARVWEAQVMMPERRFAEADSVASIAISMDSTFMLAWTWRANALLGMGQTVRAVALLERQVALIPRGRPEEAHALLAAMRARSGGRVPAMGATAAALEELGDPEAAVMLATLLTR